MEWLAQDWIWIALGIGAIFFMTRRGGMGCGAGHAGSHMHRHGAGDEDLPPAAGNRPGSLFDPVSGRRFAAGSAPISSVYRGRAYFFESRENREAFEREPEGYVAGAAGSAEELPSEGDDRERPRRRHGC
jgi:YHS domain-containing protein